MPTNRENKQHWVVFICSKVHAVQQHALFVKEKASPGWTWQYALQVGVEGTLLGSKISGPQGACYSPLLNVETTARNVVMLTSCERKVGIAFFCA